MTAPLLPLSPPALARLAERGEIFVELEPQPPDGFRSMVSECDIHGGWWLSNMPRIKGGFSVGEFAKWDHIYPKCPYPVGSTVGIQEEWDSYYCTAEEDGVQGDVPIYRADGIFYDDEPSWRPAATMPAWAVRHWPIVRGARLEREGGIWFWVLTVTSTEGD